MTELKTKKVSFDCPVDILERLDKLAKMGDMPRQRLITNMVGLGVDTLEGSKKVGIFHIALLMRNLGENMKKWSEKMKDTRINGLEGDL